MTQDFSFPMESFTAMIEARANLWDKSHDTYKNKEATRESWHNILENIYPQSITWNFNKRQKYVKKLVTKWAYIRDSYFRSEKKIENQKRFGNVTRITRPYLYHKQLAFLKKNTLFNKKKHSIDEVYVTAQNSDDSTDEGSSHQSFESLNLKNSIKIEDDVEAEDFEVLEPQPQPSVQPISQSTAINQSTQISQSTAEITPLDSNMINLMAFPTQASAVNRHISFFNGLIPTLDKFDDDQVIEFQLGVLKVMKEVKNKTI